MPTTDSTRDPRELLPLTPAAFEILLALGDGERHGYQIMRSVDERTEGALTLHAGTLYRALARLLESGLIAELQERPDPEHDDERRRYYRLTPFGIQVTRAEAEKPRRTGGCWRPIPASFETASAPACCRASATGVARRVDEGCQRLPASGSRRWRMSRETRSASTGWCGRAGEPAQRPRSPGRAHGAAWLKTSGRRSDSSGAGRG
jgi:DNA-binding MarR family transcriptional regulator